MDRDYDNCARCTRNGCTSWDCDFVPRKEAIKAYKERQEKEAQTMNSNIHTCCICGKTFEGYGNDPWPMTDDSGKILPTTARCCDACNFDIVIPLRINQLSKKSK